MTSPRIESAKRYRVLYYRIPGWLSVDHSRIETLADLAFQLDLELDGIEDGTSSIKTKHQLHQVKMLRSDVALAIAEWQLERNLEDNVCPE